MVKRTQTYFVRVRCPSCGNEQVIYSHASRVVKCLICDEPLAEPRGGKAKILAPIMAIYGKEE
ncbi:MAG: 30S ribosomal protein S27e [Thermoproteota archaeon]|nr:MAG: 30S ribosomal protein S27e [Candidatus Korarchaeota archaeon]